MRQLPTQFKYGGFEYKQLDRVGRVALFVKSKPRQKHISFEVVVVQHRLACTFMGTAFPEREVLPPSESWGTKGWSYIEESGARAKFEQLCAQQRSKTTSRSDNCLPQLPSACRLVER